MDALYAWFEEYVWLIPTLAVVYLVVRWESDRQKSFINARIRLEKYWERQIKSAENQCDYYYGELQDYSAEEQKKGWGPEASNEELRREIGKYRRLRKLRIREANKEPRAFDSLHARWLGKANLKLIAADDLGPPYYAELILIYEDYE